MITASNCAAAIGESKYDKLYYFLKDKILNNK